MQVDDAPGPAVHHLQGVEGDAAGQLDVPEPGQVVDAGEAASQAEARRTP